MKEAGKEGMAQMIKLYDHIVELEEKVQRTRGDVEVLSEFDQSVDQQKALSEAMIDQIVLQAIKDLQEAADQLKKQSALNRIKVRKQMKTIKQKLNERAFTSMCVISKAKQCLHNRDILGAHGIQREMKPLLDYEEQFNLDISILQLEKGCLRYQDIAKWKVKVVGVRDILQAAKIANKNHRNNRQTMAAQRGQAQSMYGQRVRRSESVRSNRSTSSGDILAGHADNVTKQYHTKRTVSTEGLNYGGWSTAPTFGEARKKFSSLQSVAVEDEDKPVAMAKDESLTDISSIADDESGSHTQDDPLDADQTGVDFVDSGEPGLDTGSGTGALAGSLVPPSLNYYDPRSMNRRHKQKFLSESSLTESRPNKGWIPRMRRFIKKKPLEPISFPEPNY